MLENRDGTPFPAIVVPLDDAKLDGLTLSWGSIAGIHSPKIKTYKFKNKTTVSGKAMITKDLK